MIVYFTGTGNSRYAAQVIAHKTGDQVTDAGKYIKGKSRAELEWRQLT